MGWIIAGAVLSAVFGWTFTVGITNEGNLLGTAIGVLLILYGIFRKKITPLLRRIFLSVLGLGALLVLISGVAIVRQSRQTPRQEEGTVVILGCGVRGTVPSLMLQTRIDAAADYLTAHPGLTAICSGGQGRGESISEGECIYRELTARGIAAERLRVEDRSSNTEENLRFSAEIIEKEGLSPRLILISSEYHLYRAVLKAQRQGREADTVPAHTPLRLLPTYFLRECLGVVKEWVFP
nr:YdcF family protein [Lachnospiraceae bacterium]